MEKDKTSNGGGMAAKPVYKVTTSDIALDRLMALDVCLAAIAAVYALVQLDRWAVWSQVLQVAAGLGGIAVIVGALRLFGTGWRICKSGGRATVLEHVIALVVVSGLFDAMVVMGLCDVW